MVRDSAAHGRVSMGSGNTRGVAIPGYNINISCVVGVFSMNDMYLQNKVYMYLYQLASTPKQVLLNLKLDDVVCCMSGMSEFKYYSNMNLS